MGYAWGGGGWLIIIMHYYSPKMSIKGVGLMNNLYQQMVICIQTIEEKYTDLICVEFQGTKK